MNVESLVVITGFPVSFWAARLGEALLGIYIYREREREREKRVVSLEIRKTTK